MTETMTIKTFHGEKTIKIVAYNDGTARITVNGTPGTYRLEAVDVATRIRQGRVEESELQYRLVGRGDLSPSHRITEQVYDEIRAAMDRVATGIDRRPEPIHGLSPETGLLTYDD